MRTATTVEASGGQHWSEQRDFVVEAEKVGLDVCWVAEAWGSDGPSALGYYAALTDRMLLGSGIMQVGTRTPTAVAQTAITLSNLSGGRFLLGLGASGPQVIEGLHGVPFARPLRRVRETVDIVRQVFAGGKLSYSGAEFSIPLPGGEGVPMRLSMRAEHEIPVYLASLSPAMLELTGRSPTAGSGRASYRKARPTPTSPTSTTAWPAPGARAPNWTYARAPRLPSPPMRAHSVR